MLRIDHKKIHYLILAGILLVAVIGAFVSQGQTPTGMTPMAVEVPYYAQKENGYYQQEIVNQVPSYPEKGPAQAHKIEVMDYVRYFFGTATFFFPEDPCANVIEEQLNRVNLLETSRLETFSGGDGGFTDKYRTLLFEGEKMVGAITLVQGFGDKNKIKLFYEISKAIVSINAWQETMTLRIELEGLHEKEDIFFTKGTLQVFDFQCSFGY
ncbi:hypothetical protein KY310_03695 [Candidatus Woesearchaeota archaeon]|nr:hypothetical protein [Candidatus Woesearchaeota archaeon]